MNEPNSVLRLAALWQGQVGRMTTRALLALFVLALVVGAHVARVGTLSFRLLGGFLILLALGLGIVRRVRERRRFARVEGVLSTVLLPTDRELGERALRAYGLAEQTERDPKLGSVELARLHFRRILDRVSLESVGRAAGERAARLAWVAAGLSVGAAAGIGMEPMRVVEGFDVLLARRGVAPMPLTWLGLVRVSVQPPSYLRLPEYAIFSAGSNELPEGSVLLVRGIPERSGRQLVLTDGKREVGFIPDGSGNVVARWTFTESASLRIAARFGDVLVEEPEPLQLSVLRDAPPRIELEGAPRTVQLSEIEGLELGYVVSDDHGLRDIDLVLRSGAREDRRRLIKLDGQTKLERGAHALSARDAFLRRMFLPVTASIEARDNDLTKAAKWGRSAPITILPPSVGQPQALRFGTLRATRDKLVDLIDAALSIESAKKEGALPDVVRERRAREATLRSEALEALKTIASTAPSAAPSAARASSGLSTFILGQARSLERRPATLTRTADVLLAFDAAVAALGQRDAQEVSKRLGDVAEEAAEGAKLALTGEAREVGKQRLDAALTVLDPGVRNLLVLGALGVDLGSVALGEIGRIRRALEAKRYLEAELAARHLAARLRRPTPSFGAAGGGGGGVESGRGAQNPGPASEADRQFDELMRELEQLASEHAEQIRQIEGTLSESEQVPEDDALKREATERAERLRKTLERLPPPGSLQESARAAAALGREHANGMAQNLERLALKDAVESGRRAKAELEDAAALAKNARSPSDWLDEEALSRAQSELDEHLKWAEQNLERMRKAASTRAQRGLGEASTREEGLARRAGNLAGRGEHSEAKLPDEVQDALERAEDAMRQAIRELSGGRGEEGLELAREAQRLLERSSSGQTSDGDDEKPQDGKLAPNAEGGSRSKPAEGSVSLGERARRAEEFRRRVLQGLSNERRGRLSPAVERYAEGLLE